MGDGSGTSRLYLRVPFRISEELKIKDLHPDIIKVILPRQKSTHWCYIEFENPTKCLAAYEILKKKKINGKGVKVALKTQSLLRKTKQSTKKTKQSTKKTKQSTKTSE